MSVEELKKNDAERGVVRRHVSWGPEAHLLTEDERAQFILAMQWDIERGYGIRMPPIARPTPVQKLQQQAEEMRVYLCRLRDRVLGIKNPYLPYRKKE